MMFPIPTSEHKQKEPLVNKDSVQLSGTKEIPTSVEVTTVFNPLIYE